MSVAMRVFLLAVAGACGALARVGIAEGVRHWCGTSVPWATAIANLLGCFLFGVLFALGDTREWFPADARLILLGGFMGAFTTFSTYMFESSKYLSEGQFGLAAANVMGQTVAGFLLMFAGLALGRLGT